MDSAERNTLFVINCNVILLLLTDSVVLVVSVLVTLEKDQEFLILWYSEFSNFILNTKLLLIKVLCHVKI